MQASLRPKLSWVLIALLLISLLQFVFLFAKEQDNAYSGLDLAIYTQVAHETSQGRFFNFTIHPHSYLGDHVELFLLALIPFYKVIGSPLTLLALQSLALALGAIPVFRIAHRRLGPIWGFGCALAYLLSPFLWNMAAFEFHLLPFSIPVLLAALDAYDSRRVSWFYVWSILALTVREDVALVLLGLGVLAFIQRRRWMWWLPLTALSATWFIIALQITAHVGTLGHYKFLRYYAWLGPDIPSMIANTLSHPWYALRHFFSAHLLVFFIGLGLPFALLPLGALLWLLPTVLIFLQLGLGRVVGELSLETHYTSLFLPFLFMASIEGLRRFFSTSHRSRVFAFFAESRGATAFLLSAITLYCFIVMGPIRGLAQAAPVSAIQQEQRQLTKDLLSLIPNTTPLATGYRLLPRVANRSTLASLHYVYIGTEQFSDQAYRLPVGIHTFLIDTSDFLIYHVTYPEDQEKYQGGDDRFRTMLDERAAHLQLAIDDYLLYADAPESDQLLPGRELTEATEFTATKIQSASGLRFWGWRGLRQTTELQTAQLQLHNHSYAVLPIALLWSQERATLRHQSFLLKLTRSDGTRYEKEYALSPLFPQSEWTTGALVETQHRFLIPSGFADEGTTLTLQLLDTSGSLSLDSRRSIIPRLETKTILGTVELGKISVPRSPETP